MWTLLKCIGLGLSGYVAGAIVAYLLIRIISKNRHDRTVEAAMTAAFVFGPIGAIVGIVVAALN